MSEKNNPVSPNHYKGMSNGAEVIDITENLSFNGGNAVKYIARATRQDGYVKGAVLEDLNKALWYINREIKRIESTEAPDKALGELVAHEIVTDTISAPESMPTPGFIADKDNPEFQKGETPQEWASRLQDRTDERERAIAERKEAEKVVNDSIVQWDDVTEEARVPQGYILQDDLGEFRQFSDESGFYYMASDEYGTVYVEEDANATPKFRLGEEVVPGNAWVNFPVQIIPAKTKIKK